MQDLVVTKQSCMTFVSEILELIHNPYYTFYKLRINGKCQFDEFLEKVNSVAIDKKTIYSLIALMDSFGMHKLPKTKFRQINVSPPRTDVFEFKKNNLRIYVILQKPDVYVVMGGYKNTQKQDVAVLGKRLKGFNKK